MGLPAVPAGPVGPVGPMLPFKPMIKIGNGYATLRRNFAKIKVNVVLFEWDVFWVCCGNESFHFSRVRNSFPYFSLAYLWRQLDLECKEWMCERKVEHRD